MKVLEASKDRDPLIEVILFTSYENALDRRAAFSFGAYDCLSKTIPGISFVEELSVKISKALQHRKIIPVNSQYPIVSSKILSSRALTIFLCHSSSDKPAVRELYRRLRTENISPWLDEENLLPGQDWDREIAKAVRVTDIVIVCLSRSSVTKAGYVQREIKYALDVADEQPEGTIFLIPLKLEECNIPERLRRWHWVNYFEESGYQRLMRSLRSRAETLGITVAPEIEPS